MYQRWRRKGIYKQVNFTSEREPNWAQTDVVCALSFLVSMEYDRNLGPQLHQCMHFLMILAMILDMDAQHLVELWRVGYQLSPKVGSFILG